MFEFCHRCQGELQGVAGGGELRFCPYCGAPQILLPEHLRPEGSERASTGVVPPPVPGRREPEVGALDWRLALAATAMVAGVGALLSAVALRFEAVGVLSAFWVMASGGLAVNYYWRQRPTGMSGTTGWRLGLTTGVLMAAMRALLFAVVGIVARYGLHDMGQFDADNARGAKMVVDWMQQNQVSQQTIDEYQRFQASPEIRAGSALGGFAFQAGFMVLISGAGGLLAGVLSAKRNEVAQRR